MEILCLVFFLPSCPPIRASRAHLRILFLSFVGLLFCQNHRLLHCQWWAWIQGEALGTFPFWTVFWHSSQVSQNIFTSAVKPGEKKCVEILCLVFFLPRCPPIRASWANLRILFLSFVGTTILPGSSFASLSKFSRYKIPLMILKWPVLFLASSRFLSKEVSRFCSSISFCLSTNRSESSWLFFDGFGLFLLLPGLFYFLSLESLQK